MNLEIKTMHQLNSIKTAVFEVQLAEQLRALVALLGGGGQGVFSTTHVAIYIHNSSSR